MKKRSFLIIVLLTSAVAVTASVYIMSTKQSDKTDEEIKKIFDCERITADVRATDIYCGDPNLYRNHLKENRVIGPRDFNRLH